MISKWPYVSSAKFFSFGPDSRSLSSCFSSEVADQSRYMEVGQPKLGNPPVIYSDMALGKSRFVCCIMIFPIGKGRCLLSSEYTWWDILWKLPRSSPIINTLAPTKKTIHSQIWKERNKKVFLLNSYSNGKVNNFTVPTSWVFSRTPVRTLVRTLY